MTENEFKPIIKTILKKFELEAKDIPLQSAKTPDFNVVGESSRYTIELKIKEDDQEERKRDLEALFQGEMVTKSIPTGPRNRLAAIIKEGVEQMSKHDPQHNTFHVIWLHSTGQDADLLQRRFYATLFGTQDLVSLGRGHLITCYYFNESAFFSFRDELDGAIITYEDKSQLCLQLCVNTLSPRFDAFKKSDLYLNMPEGVRDPKILESTEEAMIADCELDRKESNIIIRYLCKKYGLNHLQTINMEKHSAMMAVPKEDK